MMIEAHQMVCFNLDMKLYKFTKLEYALDIIGNGRLYLNVPEEFNDPFDCVFNVDDKATKEASDLVLNYLHFEALYKYASEHIGSIKIRKEEANKILQYGKQLKSLLRMNPYYTKWSYVDEIIKTCATPLLKKNIMVQKANYIYVIKTTMKSIRDKTLVYCFSKRNDSILMWSHYADKHKGICIEFEVEPTEKDMIEVVYSEKKSKFDILRVTSLILGLEFLKKPFDASDQEFNKKIMEPCYTKSNEWEYEKEVRYILSKNYGDRVFEAGGNYYIKSPKINSIAFGCRTDRNSRYYKDIVRIAKAKGIEIKYTAPNVDYFKLDESK